MSNECADKITTGNAAIFLQPGGASPVNDIKAAGIDGQSAAIDTVTLAGGDVTPIWGRDPRNFGGFVVDALSYAPPDDFDSGSIMFRERLTGKLPRTLLRAECPDDIYVIYGDCADPSNFLRGWNAFVQIFSKAVRSGGIERNGGPSFGDAAEAVQDQYTFKATGGIFYIGGLVLGETAGTREIADITFGRRVSGRCSDCEGIPETKDIYALMKGDGAAIAASVLYSTDGGKTYTALAITGIGATEQPVAIEVVGSYLVVVSPTGTSATQSAYYYIPLDSDTGAPEAGAVWTKVGTGFVNNFVATDAVSTEQNQLFIGAVDGYIYVVDADSIASGVEVSRQGSVALADIVRLAANCDTVAATTAAGDLLVNFGGQGIWVAVQTAIAASAGAVGVVDDSRFWAGDNTNNLLKYTADGGKTWRTVNLPLVPTAIQDILVVNRNVIYVAFTFGGAGYIAATWNGGRSWDTSGRRVLNMPLQDRINRLAAPKNGGKTIQSNWIAGAALDSAGTGGVIINGAVPVL